MLNRLKLQWRMVLLFSVTGLLVLALIGGVLYVLMTGIVQERVEAHMLSEAESVAHDVDAFFNRIGQIPVTVANMDSALVGEPDHIDQLLAQTYTVLENDPDILNIYTAYERGIIDGLDYVIPAWIYDADRRAISQMTFNFPGEEGYDPNEPVYEYHSDDSWYALAIQEREFAWGTPYFDEGGTNQLIVSAVTPIFSEGEIVGVAGVDVTLERMNEILSQVQIGETGYAYVVASDTTYIAHPTSPEVVREEKTLLEAANQDENDALRAMAQAIAAGQAGFTTAEDPHTGQMDWIAYTPIESTGWWLVLTAPVDELMQDVNRVSLLIVVVTLAGSAAMALVAFGIARSLARPIGKLSRVAQSVAEGNLNVRAEVKTEDEVGVLAAAFNNMIAQLRMMLQGEQERREYLEMTVERYNAYITRVEKGNLDLRLRVDNDKDRAEDPLTTLGHRLNDMTVSLQGLITRIREAANSLNTSSTEILTATTQQAAGASEQSAAISQTTTTVDEVRAISEQTIDRTQEVVDTSQRTIEVSHAGQDAVRKSIDSMTQIKERVESIAEKILALSEQTQQVGEIVTSVNEIATQSNMLALNASVEAARAGEHGKGFAVVAAEVRTLAEQSKQATNQVRSLLTDIQEGITGTVMATEEGIKVVDAGVDLVGETQIVINQLSTTIDEFAQTAMQVMAGGQQQASGVEQIAMAMQNINQATMQSLASTRQTEKAAQDLNTLAQQLMELVTMNQALPKKGDGNGGSKKPSRFQPTAKSEPISDEKVLYEVDGVVRAEYDPELDTIFVRWINLGPHDYLRPCVEAQLESVRKGQGQSLIVDSSMAIGVLKEEDQAWFGSYLYPAMEAAGLKAIVTVLPKSAMSRHTAGKWTRTGKEHGIEFYETDSVQAAEDLVKKYA